MNPLVKRVVLLGVVLAAGSVVLANVLARPSALPPVNVAAVATATPAPAAAGDAGAQSDRLADIQQRLSANPNDTAALGDYGDYFMQARRFAQAADAYAAMVQVDPQSSVAHQKLGGALFYQGVTTLGQAELKRAIELDPNNVEAQFNYALAMSHGPRANPAIAQASWEAVARLDPNGDLGQQAQRMLGQIATPAQPAQGAGAQPVAQDAPKP